jgi:hypothetical protein
MGAIPHIVTIEGNVFLIFTVLEAYSKRQVETETTIQLESIAILHTATEAEVGCLIAASAPFHIIGHAQHIDAQVMTRELER